jgi:hypothetical protein
MTLSRSFAAALGLALGACGPAPVPSVPQPETPPPETPVAEGEPFALDAWIAAVEEAGAQGGREAVEPLLQDVATRIGSTSRDDESRDDPCEGAATTFGGVRRVDGQMDEDPEVETAVLVLLGVTERTGEAERCEDVWLGLFDPGPDGTKLLLRSRRISYHCLFDDRETGVTASFTAQEPGPDAAFRMERQEVDACGTLVDYRYRSFTVRKTSTGLDVQREPDGEGTSYDRTPPGE